MNHKVTMLVVAIVAAMTLTAMAFAIPQQALAYRHHHNNSHNNSIKVDQQINQLNNCTTSLCANQADNTFGPQPAQVVWH
jgi:archaellin